MKKSLIKHLNPLLKFICILALSLSGAIFAGEPQPIAAMAKLHDPSAFVTKKQKEAFALVTHPRLGKRSPASILPEYELKLIYSKMVTAKDTNDYLDQLEKDLNAAADTWYATEKSEDHDKIMNIYSEIDSIQIPDVPEGKPIKQKKEILLGAALLIWQS